MWLVKTPGNYRLEVEERFMKQLECYVITDKRALHLKADQNFTDCYGMKRKAGEEWLVTNDMGSTHILDIHEVRVGAKTLKVLNKDQYCIVQDPLDKKTGKNKLGTKELRLGECEFFL